MKLQLGSTLSTVATSANGEREREERANIFLGTRKGKIEVTLVSSVAASILFAGRWTAFLSEFCRWPDAPLSLRSSFWFGKGFLAF